MPLSPEIMYIYFYATFWSLIFLLWYLYKLCPIETRNISNFTDSARSILTGSSTLAIQNQNAEITSYHLVYIMLERNRGENDEKIYFDVINDNADDGTISVCVF